MLWLVQKLLLSLHEIETFGDYLKARRLDLKLTKRDIARKLGVHPCSISNWEKNKHIPTPKFLPCLTNFMGHLPDDLASKMA